MYDIQERADKLMALLRERGDAPFFCTVTESEKQELNTEGADFSLFRTIFDNSVSLTVIRDGKKGTASGNDLTDDGLRALVDGALLSAESSVPDEANVLAEGEAPEVFRSGRYEPQMDRLYDSVSQLLRDVGARYPGVRIMELIADHTRTHCLYVNANGTRFESFAGAYHVDVEMSASDGERSTGLDYFQIATLDLDTPLIEQGSVARRMADAERSLISASIPGKFEGTVIFTPDALAQFSYMLLSNYLMSSVILEGTSQWLDKLGVTVASEKLTMSLKAADERIVELEPFTDDGYRAEDVCLIEKGVLKSQLLNLYAARKTGRPVTKNSSYALVIEGGDSTLEEMIASIDRGLIVGRFSGGEPGSNGEFSGVAKNSFYVENGAIVGAVAETMINGNLEQMFRNVLAVSRELACDGMQVLPYLSCGGIVISGK